MVNEENGWPIDPQYPSGKLNLFFDEEVQQLIDSFAQCFNVKITIFSARMEEMVVGLQNPGSAFCQTIQKKLRFRYRCCRQDKQMCECCEKQDTTIVYSCHAGLSEIIMPIKIERKLIGYAILGQFRTGQNLSEDIIQAWEEGGYEYGELQALYNSQPIFDKLSLDNMLRLFTMMISYIVASEHVKLRKPGITEQVIHWLDEHIAEPINLNAVATAINYSRSTISHTISNQLGLSFKKLCILRKIQRFESIIALNPTISIQEAANMVGYVDSLYFSRIYKKIRLAAPSSYVNSVRKQIHDRQET